MKWPFVHPARHERAYRIARRNARKTILDYLAVRGGPSPRRALVAPCGDTGDQDILGGIAEEFYGIDLSPLSLAACRESHPEIVTREGDILESGYEEGFFDLVASFLFFHHLHQVGFTPFLREFHRILRDGGLLVVLEPSALSPMSAATWLGKKIFGNVSGLVPGEAPLLPSRLETAVRDSGFRIARFEGVSFSHNRMPVPLQRLAEPVSAAVARFSPLNRASWMFVMICEKMVAIPGDRPVS